MSIPALKHVELIDAERNYIKSEFMNYRYYATRLEALDDKLARLHAKLDGCLPAIPMGDGSGLGSSSAEKDWILEAIQDAQELTVTCNALEEHLFNVDQWLDALDEPHRQLMREYVIINRCTKADDVAEALGLPNVRAVTRMVNQALDAIMDFKKCAVCLPRTGKS